MALSFWVHHVTLHVPLTIPAVLAALGFWMWRDESARHVTFIRWVGLGCLAATTLAMVAGILSAPGFLGGDGSETLRDHRDLGVTAWSVVMLASLSYDYGVRKEDVLWRRLGVCWWAVAALAGLGAGHWGGLHEHAKHIPF